MFVYQKYKIDISFQIFISNWNGSLSRIGYCLQGFETIYMTWNDFETISVENPCLMLSRKCKAKDKVQKKNYCTIYNQQLLLFKAFFIISNNIN